MKYIYYDIMKILSKKNFSRQEDIAKDLDYSVGAISEGLSYLKREGLVNGFCLSPKGQEFLNKNKVKSAIILAAGFGIRMVPINLSRPKALIKIKGQSLIERLIVQLREVGVEDISIVVGYQKEKFDYLIDKYGVSLHINMDYHFKNNLISLNIVREKIGNSYILPSDLYFEDNPFSKFEFYSWYMVSNETNSNSYIRENKQRNLVYESHPDKTNRMIGVSYISAADSEEAKSMIKKFAKIQGNDRFFWEDALFKSGFNFNSKRIKNDLYYEINTYEDLLKLDPNSKHLNSKAIKEIEGTFAVSRDKIKNIKSLKKGMTNRSFLFEVNSQKYIMRVPGEGTNHFINRQEEAQIYNLIKELKISDEIISINPNNGYKISKYIEGARVGDVYNLEDITKALDILRNLHRKNLKISHRFNLFEKIKYYKSLWIEKSVYPDYEETEKNIFKLKNFIKENKNKDVLCHMDPNLDNYLFYKEDGKDVIKLIDWEYASMQDPALDIAMLCIYSMLDKEYIDKIIDIYYQDKTIDNQRNLVYAYIAIAGLLWSNWCEIKSQLGVEFGEYALSQYRYAKDYYKLLKEKDLID